MISFSILFVLIGIIVTAFILLDIVVKGRRHSMRIMDVVWPLSGLWGGLPALWFYIKHGRAPRRVPKMQMMNMDMKPGKPSWQQIAISTLHCGAGCTLADITGEWFTYFIPISVGGSLIAGQWIFDYVLALLFGIGFQYAAIRPMEKLPVGKTIAKAFKIDFWSLTSWQVGMYGWMAIVFFVFNLALPKTDWEFWFMMRIAMFCGFITAFPMNWLLIKTGVKHTM